MKKTEKLFRAIRLILRKPALLNLVLDNEDVNREAVIEKYKMPNGLRSIDLLELIPGLNETVSPFAFLDGGSTPPDVALLKALAKARKNCDYFEIGTWRGESVANVASVARSCTTLNLPDEEMLRMGMSEEYVKSHRFFSERLPNVTHLQHNSLTFDFSPLEKKFDLIFIDGDHHYESVRKDTSHAFRLLKNEDAVIVWHDYSHTPGTNIRWDVLRGILDGTPAEKHSCLYHVSNTLCAIYTSKSLSTKEFNPYATPEKYFEVTVTARRVL